MSLTQVTDSITSEQEQRASMESLPGSKPETGSKHRALWSWDHLVLPLGILLSVLFQDLSLPETSRNLDDLLVTEMPVFKSAF